MEFNPSKPMKKVIALAIIALSFASCANRNLGYQMHPLKAAYYPRRVTAHLGPIVFFDLQIVKKK